VVSTTTFKLATLPQQAPGTRIAPIRGGLYDGSDPTGRFPGDPKFDAIAASAPHDHFIDISQQPRPQMLSHEEGLRFMREYRAMKAGTFPAC